MTSRAFLKVIFGAGTTLYGCLLLLTGALAQEAVAPKVAQPPSQAATDSGTPATAADPVETIFVTGSRIPRPNLDSPTPVTSISGQEFFQQGRTSIGDALNELPSLHPTVSQANSSRLFQSPGVNLLDLRGLGPDRTLVLQNGRRLISGTAFDTAPDVNTIPTELIERVDVVTGGNSAIYGSDAIAGVVNFVLKRHFEGVQIHAQEGVQGAGGFGDRYLSALIGKNFANGLGNVAIDAEYAHQDPWYASDSAHYRPLSAFLPVESDPPGLLNGSDGIPDQQFFRDIRYIGINNGGQFLNVAGSDANGYFPAFNFQTGGSLVPQTGNRIGLAPVGFTVGGNGSNGTEGKEFGLLPELDRYAVNLLAHYTVTDAFEPFVEAKFVRVKSIGSSVGAFFDYPGVLGDDRESIATDNPFLSSQARQLIKGQLGLAPDQEDSFFFGRSWLDFGPRQEQAQRDTWRLLTGVRGTFNTDWSYEVSGNFSELNSHTAVNNNVNVQHFLLGLDAVRDPRTGQIVCRSQIDPNAAIPYGGAVDAGLAQAELAQDVAQCVPLNPFGEGSVTPAMRNYVLQNSFADAKLTQFVLNGYVNGDSGRLFSLPGGPIGFALGAELRRETFRNVEDPITAAGLTSYNSNPPFTPPAFEVREVFGELRAPLLAHRPFFEELTLNAAGRVADYNGSTGRVFAWNAGPEWAPVHDLRLRANYAHSVRAPNLVEQYQPLGQSYDTAQDPCAVQNIGAGSSSRAANCAAAHVPANFNYTYLSSFPFMQGGNPNLQAEDSNSLTIGGVFQPRMISGLSVSVDYFSTRVNQVISSPSAQDILNACYDLPSLNNPFCSLFQRNLSSGTGPSGEVPGQILFDSLHVGPVNYAALKVRGLDMEAAYYHNFTGIGSLSTRLIYTHVFQRDQFLNPEDPNFADQVLLELGDPQDSFVWNVDVKHGPVTVGYKMRYVGKMAPGEIENIESVQGRPPQNADAFSIQYYAPQIYHDVRIDFDLSNHVDFNAGVENLTNKYPPYGLTGVTTGSSIYDNRGRFFYAGVVAKF